MEPVWIFHDRYGTGTGHEKSRPVPSLIQSGNTRRHLSGGPCKQAYYSFHSVKDINEKKM